MDTSMPCSRRFVGKFLLGGATALALGGCQPQVPPTASAPPAPPGTPTGEEAFSNPQLEQLLAPVALYPDALLAQLLMAATYPLEIVQAQRWLARDGNASLRGEALSQALDAQPWDASVKSLVPFPDVLKTMADRLEWTQQLGDAVLAQPDETLLAVQTLRRRARDAGTLASGPQQTVSTSGQAIVIEPAETTVVYVPVYDPGIVYGAWPYPAYPPYAYYYPYAGWAVGAGISFLAGAAIIGSYWGWARPGWGGGDINIDVDRVRNIDRDRVQTAGGRWQHDNRHRQGVAYRGEAARNRYQGNRSHSAAGREQYRGRPPQAGRAPDRAPPALQGLDRPGDTRAAARQGAASRQHAGAARAGGYGGARGGGFGGGGRGGGRGGRR
jgi:hypothetical protein